MKDLAWVILGLEIPGSAKLDLQPQSGSSIGAVSPSFVFCHPFIFFQLLNQFENTGPPPADKEKIQALPTIHITEEHVGKGLLNFLPLFHPLHPPIHSERPGSSNQRFSFE